MEDCVVEIFKRAGVMCRSLGNNRKTKHDSYSEGTENSGLEGVGSDIYNSQQLDDLTQP